MTAKEVKLIALSGAQPLLDVSEYCRRAGICEAEERRLLLLLGRQASCHEPPTAPQVRRQTQLIRSHRRAKLDLKDSHLLPRGNAEPKPRP